MLAPQSITGSGNRKYYVYTLAYPDGLVFYVGKGQGRRIHHHEAEAKVGCNCGKCLVIRQIWDSGNQVLKSILFETDNELEAIEQEELLINQHSGPSLVNIVGNKSKGYTIIDRARIRSATLKGKTIQGIPMVSIKELLQAYGVKASLLNSCLGSAAVVRRKFPLDSNWYIRMSDVERVRYFLLGE